MGRAARLGSKMETLAARALSPASEEWMPPLSPHRFNASLLLEGILEDTILEGTLAVKRAEIDTHIRSVDQHPLIRG